MAEKQSKTDALRAMREARFAAKSSGRGDAVKPAVRQEGGAERLPRPVKSSDGGVVADTPMKSSAEKAAKPFAKSVETERNVPSKALVTRRQAQGFGAGVAPGPSEAKREFRKPLAKDADKTLMVIKPWESQGISRRTWYRNQSRQQKEAKK